MAYLFWVHFCFVFFVCRFLKRGQIDDQCLFVLFFGFKIVLSFYLCKLFFCQLPSKKFMSRSDKEGFLCSIESGRWCQHFCFGFCFCFYLFDYLEVVNWFLLDWRRQDYYGNFGKVSSRQRTAVLSQIVFWMNNLMMKFKSFCLLDAYCGRGSTHSVTTPIKGGAFKVRVA